MEKYRNIEEYLTANGMSREELKESILCASLDLLTDVDNNFEGETDITKEVSLPLYLFNRILNEVE